MQASGTGEVQQIVDDLVQLGGGTPWVEAADAIARKCIVARQWRPRRRLVARMIATADVAVVATHRRATAVVSVAALQSTARQCAYVGSKSRDLNASNFTASVVKYFITDNTVFSSAVVADIYIRRLIFCSTDRMHGLPEDSFSLRSKS